MSVVGTPVHNGDELIVTAKANSIKALAANEHNIVALQAVEDNRAIVSDYVIINSEELKNYGIAKEEDSKPFESDSLLHLLPSRQVLAQQLLPMLNLFTINRSTSRQFLKLGLKMLIRASLKQDLANT